MVRFSTTEKDRNIVAFLCGVLVGLFVAWFHWWQGKHQLSWDDAWAESASPLKVDGTPEPGAV